MTPKEKAKELVGKFMPHIAGADRYNTTLGIYDKDISKQCAKMTVDEMIEVCESYVAPYYYEVKKEIEKL